MCDPVRSPERRTVRRWLAPLGLLAVAGLVRARCRASGVPLSPLSARGPVGPDWPERRGIAGEPLSGEMDDMDAYARPGFDPDAVAPAVRHFYEHTVAYDQRLRAHWHPGFRLGAAVATRPTRRLGQLNLPGPGGDERRLTSRIVAVAGDADPRDGARVWVRTDAATGEAVFVAVYASHVRDGERYVNIAVPLPGGNLSTVLSLRRLATDGPGTGVELTTRAPGDPGLYLVTPAGPLALPMAQRFRVVPVRAGGPTLRATHEMWVAGRQFLTVEYALRR